jgi:hypothetical protein
MVGVSHKTITYNPGFWFDLLLKDTEVKMQKEFQGGTFHHYFT